MKGERKTMLVGKMVGHPRQVSSMGKGRNTHEVMVKSVYNVVPNGERQHVPECDARQSVTGATYS